MTREQANMLLEQMVRTWREAPGEHELARMRRVLEQARYAPAAKAVYALCRVAVVWPTPAELDNAVRDGGPEQTVVYAAPTPTTHRAVMSREEHAAWARTIRNQIRSGSMSSSAAALTTEP